VLLPVKEDRDKVAFMLYNVYTQEECEKMIADTEKIGYIPAVVNTGPGREVYLPDYRKGGRCLVDSFEYAEDMWSRIKDFIPPKMGKREVLAINERFRFLRYDPGDFFKPHMDGSYRNEKGDRTCLTIQLYLNEGFKGGATTFLKGIDKGQLKGDVEIVPKTGSILIFQHDIYHEGSLLEDGIKYTVRTDILYRASTE